MQTVARVVLRRLFRYVGTLNIPVGRQMCSRMLSEGGDTLIRVRRQDLAAAVLEWIPRIAGVRDGLPELRDGHATDVENVIWCTGIDQGLS